MPFSDSSKRRGGRPTDAGAGASSSSPSAAHDPRKPIKAALDPIASDSTPSSMAVLGHAVKTLGSSWTGRGAPAGGSELLTDSACALHLARPPAAL